MSVIFVRSIFSAIKRLEELDFARTLGFDKESGRVEWRNKWTGDRAEIFFDKTLKCCKIDIYCFKNGYSFKLEEEKHMNGKSKDTTPSIPAPPKSELDKAWDEAAALWEKSEYNPQHKEEEEEEKEGDKN